MNPSTLPLRIARPQRGLSLIELMVSITLGMLVVAALLALFLNITRTNNEMAKANRQIENGRFAVQVLQNDLIHAGYWGPLGFTMSPAPSMPIPTDSPDPCVVSGWTDDYKKNLLAIPVQGFAHDSLDCVSSALPDNDVLVVSHANTCTAGSANCEGGADTGPHIQVSACQAGSPAPEAAYAIDIKGAAALKLRKKDCDPDPLKLAPLRKIVSNIYYLANSNSNSCLPATVCPTLMRASLVNGAYVVQPLIEGIEALRFEYGIDTLGRNGLPISATNPGDGSADEYVSCAPCTVDQLANVVAIKVHVLARNLEATPGYTDSKTYQLGNNAEELGPFGDNFKRHVFSTTVRLVNPSSRREAP
jgi:type IV pilus assembly protein PilW